VTASGLPVNQFGYFLVSPTTGFIASPGNSSGNLCVGSPFGRLNAFIVSSGLDAAIDVDVDTNALPMNPDVAVQPGETWHFQCWHRDGSTSNFSNGLALTFQ